VKFNTRETYIGNLKIIEQTVGARLIRNLTVIDVQHWYDEWRKPAVAADVEAIGPERIVRAHGAVTRFRSVLSFMSALRHEDCKRLAGELSEYRFEKGGSREQELTYQHVVAFIRTALELGSKGVMELEKALSMAICVAAQFELMVRQKDILGEWAAVGATRRMPAGIHTTEPVDGEVWAGFFTWELIPGWRWRMRTSKSKYRAAIDFDLTRYSLLMPAARAGRSQRPHRLDRQGRTRLADALPVVRPVVPADRPGGRHTRRYPQHGCARRRGHRGGRGRRDARGDPGRADAFKPQHDPALHPPAHSEGHRRSRRAETEASVRKRWRNEGVGF